MRKGPTIVMLAALALAGCNVTAQNAAPIASGPAPTTNIPDQELFKQARQAVLATLKDPDSAKFGAKFRRETKVAVNGQAFETVIGEVNAKNGFGGYTGMQIFIWAASDRGDGLPRVILD